jgi:hypothetical protein
VSNLSCVLKRAQNPLFSVASTSNTIRVFQAKAAQLRSPPGISFTLSQSHITPFSCSVVVVAAMKSYNVGQAALFQKAEQFVIDEVGISTYHADRLALLAQC